MLNESLEHMVSTITKCHLNMMSKFQDIEIWKLKKINQDATILRL